MYSGDTFLITTKIPFIHENLETAPFYRFMIYLDGVSVPKPFTTMNMSDDITQKSKNALSSLILDKIVELRDITTDKHGHYYANVFLENIHVNEWLCANNYAIKMKKNRKRRMSESDSHDQRRTSKNIHPLLFPPITIHSILESSTDSNNNYLVEKEKYVLPSIITDMNKRELLRSNSSISSSSIPTDVFLSHNWGEKCKNHEWVKKVNEALKKRGWRTWFDENKIDGNIRYKMAEGIDNTNCIVVFITKEYRDKVNGLDMTDNCKYEFTYAMNQFGSQNMIPVIMESEMRDTKKWKGELGAALGSMLYIDFSDENLSNNLEAQEQKYDEVSKRIRIIIHRESKKSKL